MDGTFSVKPSDTEGSETRTLPPGTTGFENQARSTLSWGERSLAEFDPLIGGRIGRFEIRRLLGEGSFGRVYEAFDSKLDRSIALKVAKIGGRNDTERLKRFLREAKAAAGLRHPNIVPIFEYGQDGDQFFIASAFIQGHTLQDDLEKGKATSPDLARAVRIVRHIAEALHYAHSQGIVHRDVKPGNTLLDENDEPMVMDFGLATRQDEAEKLTHAGQILGTPLYMAPEQAKGSDDAARPAADQYSLGVIL
ncbi:MAG: serine/threonine-protein kinase, partial [Gemmataceae bacterium]